MSTNDSNPADNFFPQLPVMARFWLWGLFAAIGAELLNIFYDRPEATDISSTSNWITGVPEFWMLAGALILANVIVFFVLKSESFRLKGNDGPGSTKYKQGALMGYAMTIINIGLWIYLGLSLSHMPH